jgi:hypothetical protein
LFVGGFPGGYDLKSDYSLTGRAIVDAGDTYNTAAGTFSFRGVAETATFQAELGGVPEPATWALMIAGYGLAGAALRRRAVAA